jgi:hypothetical protein
MPTKGRKIKKKTAYIAKALAGGIARKGASKAVSRAMAKVAAVKKLKPKEPMTEFQRDEAKAKRKKRK